MSDLIDRQAAIDVKYSHGIEENGILYVPYREVKEHLESLPSAQPEQQWIDAIREVIKCSGSDGFIIVPKDGTEGWDENGVHYMMQPETAKRTAESAQYVSNGDLISRKAVIEVLDRTQWLIPYVKNVLKDHVRILPSVQPETHNKCTETHGVRSEEQRIVTGCFDELWKRWAKENDDYSLREYKLKLAYSTGFEDGLRAKREGKENENE